MEITLTQGLLLALVAFICGIDAHWEVFFVFRPIVTAFLTGIVLGDVALGLQAGAVAELAYLGLTTIGGTVPPNPLVAGMMTVVIAHTTGQSPEAALGLSLPFALLMQWILVFYNTSFAGFLRLLDRYAAVGETKKFMNTVMLGTWITAATYAVVIFLSAYAMQEPIAAFVSKFPEWLVQGFRVAGGLLPGVGLALLLRSMLNLNNLAFLLIGFLMASYMSLNGVLPIAIAAFAIALLIFLKDQETAKSLVTSDGGTQDGI